MKKLMTAVALVSLSLPVMANALEFQPIGALGMGGAAVARNNGALTAYWNPAGGAFNETPFAMNLGVGIGARGSDGLAENVDKLSDIKFDSVKNFDNTTATVKNVGDIVKMVSIIDDINKRKGSISIGGEAPLGFAIKRFSFGVFGNVEGNILPKPDTTNILSNNTTTVSSISVTDLYTAATTGGATYTPSGYFSTEQLTNLTTKFQGASALTSTQAQQLAYAIDNQLKGSSIPANTSYDSLSTTLIPALASAGTNTFDKNTTSVMTKAIMFYEVPLSYGHPFSLGKYGRLGVGATAKIISGTVYQNQTLLVNKPDGDGTESSDLIKDITKNSKSTVNFGIDLGALYKYDKWLNVGVVAKNLNSPKFDAPNYSTPVYDAITKKVIASSTKTAGEDVKLKPQVRAGVAVEPLSWLILTTDIDLTENETVAPGTVIGSSAKSRNLGGGFEVHPYSWLRLRGGAYKNLANSDVGVILTAGLTLFVLDVDAAFSPSDTFKVGSTSLPQEAKVQLGISFTF